MVDHTVKLVDRKVKPSKTFLALQIPIKGAR